MNTIRDGIDIILVIAGLACIIAGSFSAAWLMAPGLLLLLLAALLSHRRERSLASAVLKGQVFDEATHEGIKARVWAEAQGIKLARGSSSRDGSFVLSVAPVSGIAVHAARSGYSEGTNLATSQGGSPAGRFNARDTGAVAIHVPLQRRRALRAKGARIGHVPPDPARPDDAAYVVPEGSARKSSALGLGVGDDLSHTDEHIPDSDLSSHMGPVQDTFTDFVSYLHNQGQAGPLIRVDLRGRYGGDAFDALTKHPAYGLVGHCIVAATDLPRVLAQGQLVYCVLQVDEQFSSYGEGTITRFGKPVSSLAVLLVGFSEHRPSSHGTLRAYKVRTGIASWGDSGHGWIAEDILLAMLGTNALRTATCTAASLPASVTPATVHVSITASKDRQGCITCSPDVLKALGIAQGARVSINGAMSCPIVQGELPSYSCTLPQALKTRVATADMVMLTADTTLSPRGHAYQYPLPESLARIRDLEFSLVQYTGEPRIIHHPGDRPLLIIAPHSSPGPSRPEHEYTGGVALALAERYHCHALVSVGVGMLDGPDSDIAREARIIAVRVGIKAVLVLSSGIISVIKPDEQSTLLARELMTLGGRGGRCLWQFPDITEVAEIILPPLILERRHDASLLGPYQNYDSQQLEALFAAVARIAAGLSGIMPPVLAGDVQNAIQAQDYVLAAQLLNNRNDRIGSIAREYALLAQREGTVATVARERLSVLANDL